ncbi:MAG: GatB/YqeY domain-containing protein [Patescibacteria group bacterium]|nr:GatB/YqeY domain-containing protein [Patescibacteria group bacterium]
MTIHQTIRDDIKKAMLAKDEVKTLALRDVQAEIQRELLAGKTPTNEATDEQALAIVKRLVKQRKDSIEQFQKGGRPELAAAEERELAVLQAYLPATMSREQIRPVVEAKQAELGITDKSGAGKLIGAVSRDLKGRAEGSDIKAVVDEILK